MPSTNLMSALIIRDSSFWLETGQEISGMASGVQRVADLRPALWRASVQSVPLTHSQFLAVQAEIHLLDGSLNTFYCWNPAAQYPFYDPQGTLLAGHTIQLNSIPDSTHLSLKGLPANYRLLQGEFLSFDATGSHRHLYQLMAAVTANGSGVTSSVEVRPEIRTGAAVNDVVSLSRPACEMMLLPDATRFSMAQFPMRGVSFDAVQVF